VLILIRHGESTANAERRLVGHIDVPMTQKGVEQVEAVRGTLGSVSSLYSSPLQRAVATAKGLGLAHEPILDERWVEIHYGEYDGMLLSEMPEQLWSAWRDDPHFTPKGGESLAQLDERVKAACEELFADEGKGARNPDGDVVVVSHVSPIKAAVIWALGLEDRAHWRFHLTNASITRIDWGPRGPVLHSYNAGPAHKPS
jgi:broad specificity phosphatase PhoE